MAENAFNNMVDNDNMEGPYLLPIVKKGDHVYKREGIGPTMDEGIPNIEAPIDPFGKNSKL
jgi:hypothetical protein